MRTAKRAMSDDCDEQVEQFSAETIWQQRRRRRRLLCCGDDATRANNTMPTSRPTNKLLSLEISL